MGGGGAGGGYPGGVGVADEPEEKRPALTPAAEKARAEREVRLAAALRQNLRRRKAQARAREDAAPPLPDPKPE